MSKEKRVLTRVAASWFRTWRFSVHGVVHRDACAEGYILAVPHSSFIIIASHHRGTGFVTMASRSSDGEYAALLLDCLGYDVVRGSTSSGGSAALREMVRRVSAVRDTGRVPTCGLTIDGPRGPAWSVQPGIVALHRRTGLPILPALATGPGFTVSSWDRLRIPYPFTRCDVWYGEPIRARDGEDVSAVCHRVEAGLQTLRRHAHVNGVIA